jgi:hypothetical protein
MVHVTGPDGMRDTIDTTACPLDGSKAEVLVQLESGQRVLVPVEALIRQAEGHYALTIDLPPRAATWRSRVAPAGACADGHRGSIGRPETPT